MCNNTITPYTTGTSDLSVLIATLRLVAAAARLCSQVRQVRHGETGSPSKGSSTRHRNSLYSFTFPSQEARQNTKVTKYSQRGRCCLSNPLNFPHNRGHQATKLTICWILMIYARYSLPFCDDYDDKLTILQRSCQAYPIYF